MPITSRFSPSRDKRTLTVLALAVLLVLLFTLGCFVSYQHLRHKHQDEGRAQAQRMLLAFEGHSVRLFDYADGQLRAIRSYLQEHGDDEKWERFMRDIQAPHAERFTGVVHVINRDGSVVYQSETPRDQLKFFPNMSDLDHFQYFLKHPGDSLFVGATRLGRVTGKLQYRVARPILKNGVFDGLVVLTLLPEHITDFYRSTSLGPHSTVAMMTLDQKLIARQPMALPEMFGRVISSLNKKHGLNNTPGEGGSVFGYISPFDQLQRDLFYKNLADYPVTLVVGVAEQDLNHELAELRINLSGLAGAFALFVTLVCALILRLIDQNRRLTHSEAAVRQSAVLLQASEVRLQSIFDASPDALLICDGQGSIVMGNQRVESLFGYTMDELLGQRVEVLLPVRDQASHPALRNAFVTAPTSRPMGAGRCLKARRKDGSEYDVEISLSPIRTDQGLFIASALRDITQRKLAEAELAQHRDRLEERVASRTHELAEAKATAERANNAKSRFLAAASHDLRQPLSALSMYAGLLSDSRPPSGKMLANIKDCIGSLSALLTDLLDLSKLEAGVVTPKIHDFSMAQTLASLESDHTPQANVKGLQLRLRASNWTVRSDPVLLRRILGNLIENAIRYTERGGVLVACRRRQGKTWVEVWDSGIGIAPDKTTEIFEEFKQLGDQARNNGSGLGLAIVARTAALLELHIKVRSWPGRGSVFAIELPLGLAAPANPAPAPAPPAPRAVHALRIALVDDNEMVRTALSACLDMLGYQVVAADSQAALLTELGTLAPDIVLSDYRLTQGETGFDVITAVRTSFGSEIPALLVTGDTDPALLRSMTERGILVLHKPLELETLQTVLENLAQAQDTKIQAG
jgi:PAS domain S-box-containing protein